MSEDTDYNDSAICQSTLDEEPPSGYLLQKVVSTLISHFNIMDKGTTSYESKDKILPIMRDSESPQNWRSWNAVYPPTLQNYSHKVIQATMEVSKKVLLFPDSAINDMISELQISLSPKSVAVDWTLYLYLLEHDNGMLSKHQFSCEEDYNLWKKSELEIVKGLLNGGTIEQEQSSSGCVTAGYSIAQLSLTRVKNMHKKALMSGIYSVIHFQDIYTVSPVLNSVDQNPTLNHSLSFLLRDSGCSDGKPVIVVSLWFKKSGFRSEGFLGYIKLTVQDLLECSDEEEKCFELQKRSNRSNISGEIYLKIKRFQANTFMKDLYAEIMTCIPFCYEACLRDLLEVWYSKQINTSTIERDEYGCRAIIDTISIAWNAPYYMTALISSDILYKLYTQKKIALALLKSDALDQCISFLEAKNKKLPTHAESLLTVLNSEMNENTSQELTEIVETLSTIYNIDPSNKKDVEIVVKESIHGSINHLRVIIFNDTGSTYQKVEKYTLKLKEFLSSCLFHLNDTLRDVIRIPQIVASQSATEIQEVLFKYKSNSGENVEDTFKAYDTIRDFIKVCKVASPDSASKICLRDNFFEGVISWLDTAEMEMEKWVINAIKVDNFQIIATNTYHSTSVIDMFSCFSGYVNFIKNLDWNNKEDEQLFNERLYGNMLKCLKMYTAKMIFLIKEELDSPKSDAPLKTLREVEKSTGPYTSVINHESNVIDHRVSGNKKYTLNSGDMKVTSLICAYLSNINAINSKIETLFGANKALIKFDPKTSGSRRLSEIPIPKTLSLRAQRQIKNSFIPVKVHIDKLESTVVKFPHLMPVSVRLSYNGSIIMSTKPLVQQPCTEYNESAWINLSDSIDSDTTTFNPAKGKSIYSKLEISIVKIICENGSIDTNEDIMASTLIDIDWFTDDEKIMLISIPECGKLTIKLSPISYNLRLAIFPTIVNWLVETSTNEAQTIIAQKIASVYRSHVKTISHKFKSISKDYINKMFNSIEMLEKNKKSFANSINSIIPQQQIDQEIVSQEIGPVLSVLNANLERIVSECPLTPAIKLISKIWDYIMLANESLLVPLDIESRKEKSAWSQDRVKFLEITIQILYVFFECDGEGLSKEELDTPRYKHVQKIIKDYFEPRKVLYSKKKDMFGGTSDSISEGSCSPWMPNYWIFQILKVHSDTENVYSYVREVSDLFKQIRCDLSEDITSIGSNLEPEKVK